MPDELYYFSRDGIKPLCSPKKIQLTVTICYDKLPIKFLNVLGSVKAHGFAIRRRVCP